MSIAIFIGLIFICTSIYCGENFSKLSETGILARIDLINCLKLALNLSNPRPTSEERDAAFEFVKFLNTSRSDEYLEAFYANNKIDNANRFQQFLNGILYNGNPSLQIWNSAEILTKMIKEKINSAQLEKMRETAKMSSNSVQTRKLGRTAKIIEIESSNSTIASRKQLNYIEMYRKPELILLKTLLASIMKNLYSIQI